MGLQPKQIDKESVENTIKGTIENFNSEIIKELNIEDMQYEIKIEEMKRDKDGYPYEATKASCVPNRETSVLTNKIDAVIFFTEAMSRTINYLFSSTQDDDLFHELADTFIRFSFIHELVHIQQIKNGMTFEEYFSIKYLDNPYERKANETGVLLLKKIFDVSDSTIEIFVEKLKLI